MPKRHARPQLSRIRYEAGYSSTTLAAEIGCVPSAVGHWETGVCKPHARFAKRLADTLGVSITELLAPETRS